jgi:hypothetical protein
MKKYALALLIAMPALANAGTLFQCAVDSVQADRGVRLNVIENNGVKRANLIFGTTVSGTMYAVEETASGLKGHIKNSPQFEMELIISSQQAENANIRGHRAVLRAIYPTLQNAQGFDVVETELVCGDKIADRWK